MELIILQEDFTKALNIASRFISVKPQLPILSHILLSAEKGKLQLSATNLETGIALWIGADIKEVGTIALPARTLQETISNLKKGRLTVISKNEMINIQSDGSFIQIPTNPVNDFPVILTQAGKEKLTLQHKLIQEIASQVVFASATDETKPAYTGVLFAPGEEKLDIVATDGVRLSKKQIKASLQTETNVLIPAKVMTEVAKLLSDQKKDGQVSISIQKKENQVVFELDKLILVSRLIDREFPDFKRIIPTGYKTRVLLDKEEFLKTLQLASVFAEDYKTELGITNGELTVNSVHSQYGNQTSRLSVKTEGEETIIAFNCRFLKDMLSAVKSDEVVFELNGSTSPGVFKDPKDDSFLHLIMPIRIAQAD